jgi:hypothetical protein
LVRRYQYTSTGEPNRRLRSYRGDGGFFLFRAPANSLSRKKTPALCYRNGQDAPLACHRHHGASDDPAAAGAGSEPLQDACN